MPPLISETPNCLIESGEISSRIDMVRPTEIAGLYTLLGHIQHQEFRYLRKPFEDGYHYRKTLEPYKVHQILL